MLFVESDVNNVILTAVKYATVISHQLIIIMLEKTIVFI